MEKELKKALDNYYVDAEKDPEEALETLLDTITDANEWSSDDVLNAVTAFDNKSIGETALLQALEELIDYDPHEAED